MSALLRNTRRRAQYVSFTSRAHVRYSSFTIEVSCFTLRPLLSILTTVSYQALQKKFRDPNSPFHLPPGTQGPESPDPPEDQLSPAEEGRAKLIELGYDPDSFWDQEVVWGDQDSFQ